jgi:carboxypeptidase family protein
MVPQRFPLRAIVVAVFACLSLLCSATLRAQETADVVGTVTDASGAVVPGATVTLTNIGTNISQTAPTNSSGDYVFNLLQVGSYSIKVESKGFKTFSAPNVTLAAGDRARVDAKMEVGDVTQTVEVSGSVAPALQTDTSTIGSLVPSQSVEDLPLDSRNIVRLVQLTAGATEGSPSSIAEGARPDDRRLTSAISMNGQGDSENTNLVDGFDNNERIIGFLGARPSIDAIQEVNVTSNKYDASVGRTGGAVIDVITKAGTNSFHGSAFEFLRNKVLNTNPNWAFNGTSPPNPAFRQNQYGGSVGGPVLKNKTFFFFDYEGFAQAIGLLATSYSVPTMCERGKIVCPDGKQQVGDFSDIYLVSSPGGSGTQPTTMGPDIPVASQTPLGLAFFNMYPLPTCGPGTSATCANGPASGVLAGITNNYVSSPVRTQNSKTWDARVDQHLSDKNSLWAHITYNGETTITPNGFPNVCIVAATGNLATANSGAPPCGSGAVPVEPVVTSYAGPNNEKQYSFGTSFVHVFNPNLLLNLKFGVFRSDILSFPANQGTEVSTQLGFPCTATSCVNYTTGASLVGSSGLVHYSISGLNGAGGYTTIGDTTFVPIGYWDTGFQYMGTLTWNKGNHSMRFGLALIRRRAGVAQSNAAQGQFNFNGSYTGVAGGDELEGLSSGLSRNNSLVQQGFRTWEPSGYVQDDWRARPWLTLNVGLRYDIFTPYTEVHGRISNYDPFTGLLVSPSLPGNQQSNSTGMVTTPYNDYAPRFGFAATLKHDMVLRGGFGLSFFPTNYRSDYYFLNAPFNYAVSCGIQNQVGTNLSCLTAQYDGAPGQFTNNAVATYGTSSGQTSSTVSTTGTCAGATGSTAGCGGALLSAGLPVPVLNIALATNTTTYAGTGIIGVPINQQESYLEQFNLGLQKQFGANVINIGYVGELGRHVEVNGAPENQPTNPGLAATPPLTLGGNTPLGVLPGFPWLKTISLTEANNWGTSAYEGLQTAFVRRFSGGLTTTINYTWSHMMSNINSNACVSSYFATPSPCWVDSTNGAGTAAQAKLVYGFQHYAWGNDSLDVAHRVSWGVNYEVPFGKSFTGVAKQVLGGWGINTSGSWQTGLPFSVTANSNNSGLSPTQYLDQIGSGRLSNPTRLHWFDYGLASFVQPALNTLGDEHLLQEFGPHQTRFDMSLFKDFAIREQIKLQFRTEVFNLFNQVNFGNPGASIAYTTTGGVTTVNLTGSHSTTGQITSTNATWNQREIQFALKLLF